jgi:hypothetical protein
VIKNGNGNHGHQIAFIIYNRYRGIL